jgi:hypothetical protein
MFAVNLLLRSILRMYECEVRPLWKVCGSRMLSVSSEMMVWACESMGVDAGWVMFRFSVSEGYTTSQHRVQIKYGLLGCDGVRAMPVVRTIGQSHHGRAWGEHRLSNVEQSSKHRTSPTKHGHERQMGTQGPWVPTRLASTRTKSIYLVRRKIRSVLCVSLPKRTSKRNTKHLGCPANSQGEFGWFFKRNIEGRIPNTPSSSQQTKPLEHQRWGSFMHTKEIRKVDGFVGFSPLAPAAGNCNEGNASYQGKSESSMKGKSERRRAALWKLSAGRSQNQTIQVKWGRLAVESGETGIPLTPPRAAVPSDTCKWLRYPTDLL